MKNWNKIFIIFAIVVVCFSIFYAYFLLGAKWILSAKIQELTGHKTTIEKLNIKPPLNIEIVNLKIENLLRINSLYLSPSIPNLLLGRLAFNKIKIYEPEITYYHTASVEPAKDGQAAVTEVKTPIIAAPTPVAENTVNSSGKGFPLSVKSLKVYSGKINFVDRTTSNGVINFVIKDIKLYVTNLPGSEPITDFSLKGNISWNTGEPDGKIALQGWINFLKKDMLASLKIENIDAIVFYPYYSNWVDLEKARIEKAKLNFTSNIKGLNNNVTAACHLELADIVRKVRPPEEPQQKAEKLTDAVLDMFKNMNHGEVVLDFTLRTKMDQPQFGFDNIKSAFEGKLMEGRASAGLRVQDILLWPVKWVQGGIKNGADISNAAVDGLISLGSGIKQFLEDLINRPQSDTSAN
ncbi:MAG: DUF748 domain-containing protein [Candidatus Omnitrophota bacterium]